MAILDLGPLALWDASDISSLSQDSAGSTPVTAAGQPVGRWADGSGNGRHGFQSTSGNRPTYRIAPDGTPYLEFDGSNDALLTPGLDTLMDERNVWWAAFAVEQLSRTGIGAAAAVLGKYNTTSPRNSTHFWIGYDADGTWIKMERVVSGSFIGPYTTNFDALDLGDRDIAVGWYTGSAIGAQLGSGSPVSSADTRSVGSGNAIPMRIGGNVVTGMSLGFFAGIVFDRIPDAGEQAEIFDWLRSRLEPPAVESVEGSLVATLGAASLVATGAAPASGSLNASLSALTLVASGEAQSPPVVGELDATLGALTATATASAPAAGLVSASLGAAVLSSAGESEIAGAVGSTLGSLSVAATGESTVTGSMSASLGGLMLVASGGVLVAGALDATLGALTADAQASAPAAGVVGAMLGELSAQASGSSSVAAQLDVTLGGLSLYSINGTPETNGSVDVDLASLTGVMTGRVRGLGAVSATLGGLTVSSTASAAVQAVLSGILAPLAITADGIVPVAAVLDVDLDALTLTAQDESARSGPYSAVLRPGLRGSRIDASTRGASVSAAARRAQIRRVG